MSVSGISDWSERRREEAAPGARYSPSPSPLLRDPREYLQRSPAPDYRSSPARDKHAPLAREVTPTPTPPQRKKAVERRQRFSQDSRYDSGYRTPSRNETRGSRDEPLEEPPPDYSPPSPPAAPPHTSDRKQHQKTRFAEPVKQKSGNIIGKKRFFSLYVHSSTSPQHL